MQEHRSQKPGSATRVPGCTAAAGYIAAVDCCMAAAGYTAAAGCTAGSGAGSFAGRSGAVGAAGGGIGRVLPRAGRLQVPAGGVMRRAWRPLRIAAHLADQLQDHIKQPSVGRSRLVLQGRHCLGFKARLRSPDVFVMTATQARGTHLGEGGADLVASDAVALDGNVIPAYDQPVLLLACHEAERVECHLELGAGPHPHGGHSLALAVPLELNADQSLRLIWLIRSTLPPVRACTQLRVMRTGFGWKPMAVFLTLRTPAVCLRLP